MTIKPGDTLENPVTGERFTFTDTARSTGGELLAFDFALRPGGAVPIPHVHPIQTERFEVTRAHEVPRGPAQDRRRPRRHHRGRAGCGPLVRQRRRRRGAAARRGPPGARDGERVRRGRRHGPGGADEPARHAAQPPRPRRSRAQVRQGGARPGAQRPRPAPAPRAACVARATPARGTGRRTHRGGRRRGGGRRTWLSRTQRRPTRRPPVPAPSSSAPPSRTAGAPSATRFASAPYYPDLAVPGAADTVGSFAELAVRSGVRRLVLLAGRGEPEAEDAVRESGADLTIVRSTWFAQNFSEDYLVDGVRSGEVGLPAGGGAQPVVDAR